MLDPVIIPSPTPAHKVPGYKMPEGAENLLHWDFVADQMAQARYYWLATTYPDGRPHSVPVWGIWHDNRVHFDGSPKTTWATHLFRDGRISVHLPDAEKVVIIEGVARTIADDEIDEAAWDTLDSAYRMKYGVLHGSPYWFVQPHRVLAWDGANLHTMTRWQFA